MIAGARGRRIDELTAAESQPIRIRWGPSSEVEPGQQPDVGNAPGGRLHLEEHAVCPPHPHDEVHAAIEIRIAEVEPAAIGDWNPIDIDVVAVLRFKPRWLKLKLGPAPT